MRLLAVLFVPFRLVSAYRQCLWWSENNKILGQATATQYAENNTLMEHQQAKGRVGAGPKEYQVTHVPRERKRPPTSDEAEKWLREWIKHCLPGTHQNPAKEKFVVEQPSPQDLGGRELFPGSNSCHLWVFPVYGDGPLGRPDTQATFEAHAAGPNRRGQCSRAGRQYWRIMCTFNSMKPAGALMPFTPIPMTIVVVTDELDDDSGPSYRFEVVKDENLDVLIDIRTGEDEAAGRPFQMNSSARRIGKSRVFGKIGAMGAMMVKHMPAAVKGVSAAATVAAEVLR